MNSFTRTTKLHWLYFVAIAVWAVEAGVGPPLRFHDVEGQEHPFETGVGPITKAIDERQSRYPWRKKQ